MYITSPLPPLTGVSLPEVFRLISNIYLRSGAVVASLGELGHREMDPGIILFGLLVSIWLGIGTFLWATGRQMAGFRRVGIEKVANDNDPNTKYIGIYRRKASDEAKSEPE